jgi:glutamine amidotransferase
LKSFLYQFGDINVNIIENLYDLAASDMCIIPGVGHFSAVMNGLEKFGLIDEIIRHANSGKLLIGICAGAQILLESSEESPGIQGLGLIAGHARSLKQNECYKNRIPRIGWQHTQWRQEKYKKLNIFSSKSCYYFAHSYELIPNNNDDIAGSCVDGVVAAINNENIWGLQFHPEKSQDDGVSIIQNLIKHYA